MSDNNVESMLHAIKQLDFITAEEFPQAKIQDKILDVMAKIPRAMFVPKDQLSSAYLNHPLPIGYKQTISQPYIVALMTSLLDINSTSVVLEIGTGSGYQAAILSKLAKQVYSIEVVEELAKKAKQLFVEHNFVNITCIYANGYDGWPVDLHFDAIIVTAAAKKVPEKLFKQLKIGAKMVIPLEDATGEQVLCVVEKLSADITDLKITEIIPVRFVPMVEY